MRKRFLRRRTALVEDGIYWISASDLKLLRAEPWVWERKPSLLKRQEPPVEATVELEVLSGAPEYLIYSIKPIKSEYVFEVRLTELDPSAYNYMGD